MSPSAQNPPSLWAIDGCCHHLQPVKCYVVTSARLRYPLGTDQAAAVRLAFVWNMSLAVTPPSPPLSALRFPRLQGLSANRLDRAGMWLSAACAVHCLTTAIVVVALSSFGGALLDPHIHEVGLIIAMVLGAVALGSGVMKHGYMLPFAVGSFGLGMMAGALLLPHGDGELVATLLGVMTLALGHDLNGRARCPSIA
jgi:hypothetical protein